MNTRTNIDFLLINPGNAKQVYQSLGDQFSAIENPVWAGLMAGFILKHGYTVEVVDANAEGLAPKQTAQRVKEIDPKLVVVVVYGHQPSASTQNMPAAGEICNEIKKAAPEKKILMVGGHVASLPERTLREEAVDFVSSGEGLYTMVDLIEVLKSNDCSNLHQVRDLWYREGEENKHGQPAPLIKDIDHEMPGIPWHLFPMNRYRAHNWHCFGDLCRTPYASIYTSLGCPYRCSFCCIHAPFKSGEKELGMKEEVNSYRCWSPRVVVDQIGLLVEQYGVRNIKIADEIFVLKQKHVEGICDLIIERGYKLNIWAYARVDSVRDEMIDKMKRAGINWLAFGIEAGNSRVRDEVQKGIEADDILKIIGKVRKAGINVIGNYIFGLPEDDRQSMQDTLDLAIDLNCEFANFYCAMAYPGSALYLQAIKEKWPLPEKWSGYSQHSVDMLPLPTKYLPASEVIKFRDEAFQTYFNHPNYLSMIRNKFGADTENHIREMVSHKLVRQNAA